MRLHSISEEEWGVLIEQLHNDIPKLSDTEIVTRLTAMDAVTLTVRDRSGQQRTVSLTPISADNMEWLRIPASGMLMLSHENQRFWHEWLNEGEVLYVHLYEINDDSPRLLVPWFNQVLAEAVARGTKRLILDLRRNYGGDSSHNRGLVMAIKELGEFDKAGKTLVLIGRSTFSAAQNLVNDLEQWTRATLVGEPTGSRPGSYGDSRKIRLQHSGLTVRVSSRYHQDWLGPIGRLASLPDVAVPLLASDWLAGNDSALTAALNHQVAGDPGIWYKQLLEASGFDHATIRLWQYRNDPLHAQEDFSASLEAVTRDLIGEGRIDEAYYTALLSKNLFPDSAATTAALSVAMKARGDGE